MPERRARRPSRRRRWLIASIALLALLGCGLLALRHYARTETLTALLVRQTRDLTGAELTLGEGAHFDFLPRLHLVLPQPALTAGGPHALLRLDSLEADVPWHSLWSRRFDIERLELVRPVLDLDALHAWLDARPPAAAPLPDIRFVLRVTDGAIVRGSKLLAQDLDLQFASGGDVAAWLARIEADPATTTLLPPLAGSAAAATIEIGDTRLEDVHIEVLGDDATSEPQR